MATNYIYLQGKTTWFKFNRINDWGKWSHNLYLNADSLDTFRKLQEANTEVAGIKNTLKKDDDGYYAQISRPAHMKRRGREEALTPPAVFEADGKTPWQGGLIGNGSDVTSKIEVYDYPVPGSKLRGRAIRWVSTKVDKLVPFEAERDNLATELREAKGLAEQPPQF